VRRGERATAVVFWRFQDAAARGGGAPPAEDGEEEGEEGARRGPWARAYAVFNAAQADGAALPADRAPRLPEGARIAAAERFPRSGMAHRSPALRAGERFARLPPSAPMLEDSNSRARLMGFRP